MVVFQTFFFGLFFCEVFFVFCFCFKSFKERTEHWATVSEEGSKKAGRHEARSGCLPNASTPSMPGAVPDPLAPTSFCPALCVALACQVLNFAR